MFRRQNAENEPPVHIQTLEEAVEVEVEEPRSEKSIIGERYEALSVLLDKSKNRSVCHFCSENVGKATR